ncbi:hypothetical protein [uncultured Roseobacter sp.]|uniref:hypothetical protein n=1 Tax=uncultured Roseobacter sp. TaxID=114847 RepID=UPI00260E9BB0|nr:hypothetical protein [uncultured Roseobacter sp.]
MDFIFRNSSEPDKSALTQGDVIARTDDVVERLQQAHQYYADAPLYSHFVVLTQSCDLVKRRGDIKAPYITIAAAKPFRKTIQEYFDDKSKTMKGAEFTFHSRALIEKAKQLVERHLNNTEPEYFFLPKSGNPSLPEDLLVFLRLTIALRKEHYDTLASAKIAELADVFQAKLGWLKGNIYSRVATPDIEERDVNAAEIKQEFFDNYVPKDELVWLSNLQADLLRKRVKAKSAEEGRDLTTEEVLAIIEADIPDDTQIVANNIVDRLVKNRLIEQGDSEATTRFARAIANESSFKSVVKAAQS